MRKMMSKEVPFTLIKSGIVGMNENGQPIINQNEDEIVLGTLSFEKAQKHINKKYNGQNVTIFHIENFTKVYEMSVEEFIQHAEVKS